MDDSLKTTFELALLPTDNEHKIAKIVGMEYKYRHDNDLSLPFSVSKYRLIDYVSNIYKEEAALELIHDNPFSVKTNIKIEEDQKKPFEIELHYGLSWAALITALSYILVLTGSILSATAWPLTATLCLSGLFLGKLWANYYGHFDMAENIFRLFNTLFNSSDISLKGKFGFIRSLKTLASLGGIIMASFIGGIKVFNEIWSLQMGLLLTPIQLPIAILLSTTTSVGIFMTLEYVVRSAFGLTFYDNTIPVDDNLKKVIKELPVVIPKKKMREETPVFEKQSLLTYTPLKEVKSTTSVTQVDSKDQQPGELERKTNNKPTV